MRALWCLVVVAGCSSVIGIEDPKAAPDTLVLVSGANPSGTVGAPLADPIIVGVRDLDNNGVPGAEVTFAVAMGGGQVSAAAVTTDEAGNGQTMLTLGTTAGSNKLLASTPDATMTLEIVATGLPGPVDASASTASADPATSLLADGAATSTVTIVLRDSFSNPIAGQSATIAATGTGNAIGQPAPTDPTGTSTGTIASTVAGAKTLTVSAGAIALAQTPSVTFVAGQIDPAKSTVIASPANALTADGTDASTITVKLVDIEGNPIAGETVSLAVTGTANTVSTPAPTDAAGITTATLTTTHAESKTITASIGTTTLAQKPSVAFVAGPPDAGVSTLTVNATGLLIADGTLTATITATIVDAFGNPIQGATVVLASTGVQNTLVQPGPTNASGVATGTIASTRAETKTISASVGATTLTQQPTIGFIAGPAAKIAAVSGDKQAGIAHQALPLPLLVVVTDAHANPVAGTTVSFVVTAGGGSVAPASGQSDANGNAQTVLTLGGTPGTDKVEARANGLTGSPVVFTTLDPKLPTFGAATNFGVGTTPQGIAFADFNGDGRADLVIANRDSSTVSVLLSTTAPGATTPAYAAKADFPTATSPSAVVIGDFNGDGRPDIATVCGASNVVSVLLDTTAPGAPTPSFAARSDFGTGGLPLGVAVADFNGDGILDLVTANSTTDNVSVLLGTTPPGATVASFATKTDITAGDVPLAILTRDFNGDGRADVAVVNQNGGSVSILLSTTAPNAAIATFAAKADFSVGVTPVEIAGGDFNGDGKPDLAVANDTSGTVSILLDTTPTGAATASFAASTDIPAGTNPIGVTVADFNDDGKPDVAVANVGTAVVSVLVDTTPGGSATATFAVRVSFAVDTNPFAIAAADVNGDGKPDFATANETGTTSVVLNTSLVGRTLTLTAKTDFGTGSTPEAIAVGDLNGDGRPDIVTSNNADASLSVLFDTTPNGATTPSYGAAATFGTGTNPLGVALADFNGDGRLDIAVGNKQAGNVSILLNTTAPGSATPSFAPRVDLPGIGVFALATADLNGDGRPDLVITDGFADVGVYLDTTVPGATTPTFAARVDFATANNTVSVAIGDFNGDGRDDLAVVAEQANALSVLLNTTAPGATTPSFATHVDITFAAGTIPRNVAVADVDGDGRPDIAIANLGLNNVSIFLDRTAPGATTPVFAAKADFPTATQAFALALGDMDGDGRPDLVVTSGADQVVSVLLDKTAPGAATATFAPKVDFATSVSPLSMTLADVDGNGRLDIVTARSGDDVVSVLLDP